MAPRADAIGPGEQVAYSCGGSLGGWTGQICVMRPDGSDRQLLIGRGRFPRSTRPDGLTAPAWSSDGGQLAFVGKFHENLGPNRMQLYRVNADGTGLRPVGRPLLGRASPALSWSPDGAQIAVSDDFYSGPIDLIAVPAGGRRQVATGISPRFRPGTTELSFERATPAAWRAIRPELPRRFAEWVWTVDLVTGALRPARSHVWTRSGLLVTVAHESDSSFEEP